ncbi:hypothetical protein [Variovorax sp. GT1P44]|uniref:hypothetical protein n=1 Tax=Variovorax sp. GT1P44 TaxID=3443742 RepID=UPI003F4577C1
MVHPSCAPARPPDVPPADDNALHPTGATVTLAAKATAELDALREAYHATACISNFMLHVLEVPKSERYVSRSEVEALVALVEAELQRRMHAAKATVASMQVPPRT